MIAEVGSSRARPGSTGISWPACTRQNEAGFAGPAAETEAVAFDVVHAEVRLVDAIGTQWSHAYRAEGDQSCALGRASGNTPEEQSRPHNGEIAADESGP